MRESQYIEDFLNQSETKPLTISTYLTGVLKGRAASWKRTYQVALRNAINRRVQAGTVERCTSVHGAESFRRIK